MGEEDCIAHNGGNCIWGQTDFGDEPRCVGWEASGMCPGLPDTSFWGKKECPCVGFIGLDGEVNIKTGADRFTNYSAGVGSICKEWDSFVHPDCQGEKQPEWCHAKWCLVDPKKCDTDGSFEPAWLPDAAFQGHRLHASYETCGKEAPESRKSLKYEEVFEPVDTEDIDKNDDGQISPEEYHAAAKNFPPPEEKKAEKQGEDKEMKAEKKGEDKDDK